ncbi:hypothetical protein FQZ97_312060 [compost metagenome]
MNDAGAAAVAFGLAADDRLYPFQHLLAHPGVEGAQAQAQQCALGNHVGGFTGLQGTDRDHCRLLRVDVASDHRLQRHHRAGGSHQRIRRQMRHGAVATNAFDHDFQQVL